MEWKTPQEAGSPLPVVNFGASCWFNAPMQGVVHVPAFGQLLREIHRRCAACLLIAVLGPSFAAYVRTK